MARPDGCGKQGDRLLREPLPQLKALGRRYLILHGPVTKGKQLTPRRQKDCA
jgi:hypothetical protein